jgi:hypothetical protein
MQRIIDFIHNLSTDGVNVIVITENPDVFNGMNNISAVGDWNDSWKLVDEKVGENRRILHLDNSSVGLQELDGVETYVQAGILEGSMLWINSIEDKLPTQLAHEVFNQLRHLVVILNGKDFYTSLETLKSKLPDYKHQDFIVGPHSKKQDSDELFYYRPQALTLIIEWPRMVDRESVCCKKCLGNI